MELDLKLDPKTATFPQLLEKYVAKWLGLAPNRIKRVDILRRSIDARQRNVIVNLRVKAHIDSIEPLPPLDKPIYKDVSSSPYKVNIVGMGPAGLFAALRLLELGIKPVIFERGKDVDSRRKDLAQISRTQTVNPDSNYAFGEGGAGTYSDGKLYTRSKKRGDCDKVLRILHLHGASRDILIDAYPHIGSNRLPQIIKSIRRTIIEKGGQVHFKTRVTDLLVNKVFKEVYGVVTQDGQSWLGPVILCTGHSASDIYRMLHEKGIDLETKGIAVGVRLEHPSLLIENLQYHTNNGRGPYLPPAQYTKLTRVDDRAVYSFCMCPGGVVVPAATSPGQLVVNGMSSAGRCGKFSNAGMVVEILPEDIPGDHPLKMLRYRDEIENKFGEDAKGTQNSPAQRMTDFVISRPSSDLPPVSYQPGVHVARVDLLLPRPVAYRLQQAFIEFGRKQPGFLTENATVIGAETRTSSPVRIPRCSDTLAHTGYSGLFPAGEGAGYAGGIVSAAVDGDKAADAAATYIHSLEKT